MGSGVCVLFLPLAAWSFMAHPAAVICTYREKEEWGWSGALQPPDEGLRGLQSGQDSSWPLRWCELRQRGLTHAHCSSGEVPDVGQPARVQSASWSSLLKPQALGRQDSCAAKPEVGVLLRQSWGPLHRALPASRACCHLDLQLTRHFAPFQPLRPLAP